MKKILVLVYCIVLGCGAAEPFRDNQRVVFLGDSITHYGRWWPYVWSYYITRFPERDISFFNAGISGDTATGALGRLQGDVLDRRPDRVCVMFGMNDIGRNWYKENPEPEDLQSQQDCLARYERSMREVLGRLTASGLPVIVVTPSPYDQGMVSSSAQANKPGCNDGLARAALIAQALANTCHCDQIDFHAPMTDLLKKVQNDDPAETLIGPDRIHPRSKGSWIMAWLFLKAQGLQDAVAEICIDFKTKTVLDSYNATAEVSECGKDGVTIDYLPNILPLPAAGSYHLVDRIVSLSDDLNRETVRIRNLPKGVFRLYLNGLEAGSYSSEQLGGGVNIGILEQNPNQRQAQRVFETLYAYVALQRVFQDIEFLDSRVLEPNDVDIEDVAAGIDFFQNRYNVATEGDRIRTGSYLKWRGREDQLMLRLQAVFEEVRKLNKTVPVKIRIDRGI